MPYVGNSDYRNKPITFPATSLSWIGGRLSSGGNFLNGIFKLADELRFLRLPETSARPTDTTSPAV